MEYIEWQQVNVTLVKDDPNLAVDISANGKNRPVATESAQSATAAVAAVH